MLEAELREYQGLDEGTLPTQVTPNESGAVPCRELRLAPQLPVSIPHWASLLCKFSGYKEVFHRVGEYPKQGKFWC